MPAQTVQVTGVSHSFELDSGEVIPAISSVDLRVEAAEFVVLIGPSGCGKTTLLNLVAGLFSPTEGSIAINGLPVEGLSTTTGYMLARDALYPWRTAIENVMLGLEFRQVPRQEAERRAQACLELVGLSGFANHKPAELSQGMRQRIALARTFAIEPDLLLLDEPFGALDAQTKVILEQQLTDLWERKRPTVLLVTHDLEEAVVVADRIVVCSARPCRIKEIVSVPFPRPRRVDELRFDSEAQGLFKHLWNSLKAELHD